MNVEISWVTIAMKQTVVKDSFFLNQSKVPRIPTHGRAKAGRPARTYIQQLCEDTGCCPEDLPRAMNDREEWRERVRDTRAASTIWWWWFIYSHPRSVNNAYILLTSLFVEDILLVSCWILNRRSLWHAAYVMWVS